MNPFAFVLVVIVSAIFGFGCAFLGTIEAVDSLYICTLKDSKN
jgi:hypothetical protein